MSEIAIIGAGFSGLAAGLELALAGHQVTLLEAEPFVGGLAGSFEILGETGEAAPLDRFYHHWFTSDAEIMDLVATLGLQDKIRISATRTGVWYNRSFFRLSSPLDLLRFTALPLPDRIRLGLLYLRARRLKDWRALEGKTAKQWLIELGGEQVWRILWQPLLQGKFGAHAEEISAVWIWNKLKLRGGSRGAKGEERLAYLQGSFALLAEACAKAITQRGGRVLTRHEVAWLKQMPKGRWQAGGDWGVIEADAVITTIAPPLLADLMEPFGQIAPAQAEALRQIPYLANLCLVLELDRSLSSTYWLNVNDPSFPFVGVIEHTNFVGPEEYGGRHILYLSRYLAVSDPLWAMTDEDVLAYALPHLRQMFPAFEKDWLLASHIWRARWAQPVVGLHYSRLIPPMRGPLSGLFQTSMAQIYPEDRGTNHAVREGRRVAGMVMRWLCDG